MTDKPRPDIQPERAVALIRKKRESAGERRAAHLRKLGLEFDRREEAFRVGILARVPEQYRESARAMLRAIDISVPGEGEIVAVGIADASPESKPVIDSEFAEAAEADEDGRTVYEHIDSELKARDLELTVGEGQTIAMPAWALQEPPVTSKPIEIDRTLSKGKAR